MIKVVEIWRHPIKSHGREALNTVAVTAGQTLPLDRAWAVAHDQTDADGSEMGFLCQFFTRSQGPVIDGHKRRVG